MAAYTYIVTNPGRKVLYVGVTNDLRRRIVEHYLERGSQKSFAGRYYCFNLIWYDSFPSMHEAIQAEKRIKGKKRKWKEDLVSQINPSWNFLNKEVLGEWPPNKTQPPKSS
ncbi:MAG: endonuclease [Balneola sp.]|jgi:putative endonuclease|nr:endonuclease [Balneola sp.]MBE79520.1 endonuclease [Balneola sp.]HBX66133.1 endonuclease [Balneolaceae bacterium]|tara:strand:- start:212 stop:544 length:333 start_codon:yes stop_codon:yes gene_type:complete